MNLLSQFDQLFDRQEKSVARITGNRGGGKLAAQTQSGATVILTGDAEIGSMCYYDRVSGKVLGQAPDVTYAEYGV